MTGDYFIVHCTFDFHEVKVSKLVEFSELSRDAQKEAAIQFLMVDDYHNPDRDDPPLFDGEEAIEEFYEGDMRIPWTIEELSRNPHKDFSCAGETHRRSLVFTEEGSVYYSGGYEIIKE